MRHEGNKQGLYRELKIKQLGGNGYIALTENLLKDGSPISGWIHRLDKGIKEFADELGSDAIQASAARLGQGVADLVKLFDAIIAKYPKALERSSMPSTMNRTTVQTGLARHRFKPRRSMRP
jgi:hypothetical protein